MKKQYVSIPAIIGLFSFFLWGISAKALILSVRGNDPVSNSLIVGSDKLPEGAVKLADLPTRIGYWEGPSFSGGEYHFLYKCSGTEHFNEALKIFASITTPKLELIIHHGPKYDESMDNAQVDWSFTVWSQERWKRTSKSGYPAPTIDVYIGNGSIAWEKVSIPGNLSITDTRVIVNRKIMRKYGFEVEYPEPQEKLAEEVLELLKPYAEEAKKDPVSFLRKDRERILSAICAQLALESPTPNMIQMLDDVTKMAIQVQQQMPSLRKWQLWDKATLKNLLAGEIRIPDFSYDKTSDKVFYKGNITVFSENEKEPAERKMPIVIDFLKEEAPLAQVQSQIKNAFEQGFAIPYSVQADMAIH